MRPWIALVPMLAALTACASGAAPSDGPRVVQPGAPGEPSRTISSSAPRSLPYSEADVAFMQGMIHHHAQALDMVNLLKTNTQSDDMKLLAQRIEISQRDEIGMMATWLRDRNQDVPEIAEHAGHGMMAGMMMMPGMLTEAEMAELGAARGEAFDRLFLAGMIKHHEGALIMVRDLFAQAGAAQTGEIFAFASDVEADQSIEIRRMRAMLAGRR